MTIIAFLLYKYIFYLVMQRANGIVKSLDFFFVVKKQRV